MYDPIDEKQAAVIADGVQVNDLIEPLEQAGVISGACASLVRGKMRELFKAVEAGDGADADEDYWRNLQQHWGFAELPEGERITPMNAANLCPAPTVIIESINLLRTEYNNNVSQQKRQGRRLCQMRRARELVAQGLGLDDPDDVAIVRNASEANNAINCGYQGWDPDGNDNVVLWRENHPTNLEAWNLRAQWNGGGRPSGGGQERFGVRIVDFATDASDQEVAASFIDRIDSRTRFVTFTETSNGNGFRIPEAVVKKIWQHIQDQDLDCHLHIDATMTWGARPINLRRHPYCHSLVSSAHKWFLGPKETGILYMAKEKARNFMPSIFAYDEAIDIHIPWTDMPDNAQRFALLGQRDDVHIINLDLAEELWLKLAPKKPYERVGALAKKLKEKLVEHDWELVTPEDMSRSWGVVRIRAPKEGRSSNLYNWLYEAYRIAGSGDDDTFRLCPHIYNTMDDIDRAVQGMNAWRDK